MAAPGVVAGTGSKSPRRREESVGCRDVGSLQMPTHGYGLIERIGKAATASDGVFSRQGQCTVGDRKSCHQSIVATKDLFLAYPHEHVDINQYVYVRVQLSADRASS